MIGKFPAATPQPPEIPEHVSDEIRALWPEVVHALIDSGVELLQVHYLILEMFCSKVVQLRECRRDAATAVPEVAALLRQLESDQIRSICDLAGELMLPQSALSQFLA
jgi:phage terminase small subunit